MRYGRRWAPRSGPRPDKCFAASWEGDYDHRHFTLRALAQLTSLWCEQDEDPSLQETVAAALARLAPAGDHPVRTGLAYIAAIDRGDVLAAYELLDGNECDDLDVVDAVARFTEYILRGVAEELGQSYEGHLEQLARRIATDDEKEA